MHVLRAEAGLGAGAKCLGLGALLKSTQCVLDIPAPLIAQRLPLGRSSTPSAS